MAAHELLTTRARKHEGYVTISSFGFGGSLMRTPRSPISSVELAAKLNLLGTSPPFKTLLAQIERFASCDATILIQGETGTGKELAARAMHYLSARAAGPFIPINCGAIPETLIGSELFGHLRGAFTDAREAREGLVAQAEGGTLFLDELEALSLPGQIALLRFLQDYEYRPLGAANARTANVRVIGATNEDLEQLVGQGRFRRDLLYRLNVLSVAVPPLRVRGDDVMVIARAYLAKLATGYRRRERTLHPEAIGALRSYDWPGNVRELENLIHREFLLSDEPELRLSSVPRPAAAGPSNRQQDERDAARPALTGIAFREAKARAIAEFEREYVRELLSRTGGNVSLAARLAGKERSRLNRLLRKYRISAQEFKTA
jgi:DNA-binding NtrC family response regulator